MSGKFGSAALAAGVITQIGTTVPDSHVWTLNIRFANSNNTAANVTVWVGTDTSPQDADCVTPDTPVSGKSILEDTGIVITAGEKIWVKSSAANVAVRVHGHSKVVA